MSLDNSNNGGPAADAIVIGAGVAGLAAAFTLRSAGLRVLILEARGEVGGRVLTHPDPKLRGIDLGAAYFGPLQTYTMRFNELLEIERISNDLDPHFYHRTQWSNGEILAFNQKSFAVPDDSSQRGTASKACEPWALVQIERDGEDDLRKSIALLEGHVLRMKCNLEQPWNDLLAPMHDAISVDEWLTTNVKNPYVQDLLRIGVRSALSAEPSQVSMAYLLYYCATGGSFVNVMAVGGGADSYRYKNGASELPLRLAAYCTSSEPDGPAATLLLDHQVTKIEQDDKGVTVHVATGKGASHRFQAPRCIVAASPTARGRFGIVGLPAGHQELAEKMDMGRTIKAFVTFDKPWWRIERGASGYALSARTSDKHPVVWTMDNTWTGDDGKPIHCLMAFIVGDRADELASLSPQQREQRVLDHWATIFGVDRKVIDQAGPKFHEHVWDRKAWSGGCPAAFFRPSTFCTHARYLREPFERIHWAGAETGTDWVGGYMNGGLQSGMRAAWEVVAHAMAASAGSAAAAR